MQFLPVPVMGVLVFGAFVALAVARRRDPQSHKLYMLLASIGIVSAAIVRWPFAIVAVELPGGYFGMSDVFSYLFVAPLVLWDFYSRRRLHPVTLKGGLVLLALPVFVRLLAENRCWLAVAGWAVGLPGH